MSEIHHNLNFVTQSNLIKAANFLIRANSCKCTRQEYKIKGLEMKAIKKVKRAVELESIFFFGNCDVEKSTRNNFDMICREINYAPRFL